MATGRLGSANITGNTDNTLYTVPASTFSVVTVSIANRGTEPVAIKLALAASGTPGLGEYLEYDSYISAKGVLERTGIVMDAGKLIVVSTPTASPALSVNVFGIETSTI